MLGEASLEAPTQHPCKAGVSLQDTRFRAVAQRFCTGKEEVHNNRGLMLSARELTLFATECRVLLKTMELLVVSN